MTDRTTIPGMGDMNGDGMADILWRDADGSLQIWLMQGDSQPKMIELSPPVQGWEVIGTGGCDGSRITGMLWRHNPSGVYRKTMADVLWENEHER